MVWAASKRLDLYVTEENKVIVHAIRSHSASTAAAAHHRNPAVPSGGVVPQSSNGVLCGTTANGGTIANEGDTIVGGAGVRRPSTGSSGSSLTTTTTTATTATIGNGEDTRSNASEISQQTSSTPSPTGTAHCNPFRDNQCRGKLLVFSPQDGSFHVDTQFDDYTPTLEAYRTELRIHGLIGLLDLDHVQLLFYVKRRKLVANIGERGIFQIVEADYVTVHKKSYPTLAEEQQEAEAIASMLRVLDSQLLYFSYDHDLTASMQHTFLRSSNNSSNGTYRRSSPTANSSGDAPGSPFFEHARDEFWWNKRLVQPFLADPACHNFVIPIICGYVGHLPASLPVHAQGTATVVAQEFVSAATIRKKDGVHKIELPTIRTNVDILLISRMHRKRVGTRYTRRGLDEEGFSANFVETELVVMTEQNVASSVQCRGSVPWLWKQETNLAYKPPIDIEPGSSRRAFEAYSKHMDRLREEYGDGPIIAFNLLNTTGYEKPLGEMYRFAVGKRQRQQHRDSGGSEKMEYHEFDLNQKPRSKAKEAFRMFRVAKRGLQEQGVFSAKSTTSAWPWFGGKSNHRAQANATSIRTSASIVGTQSGVFRVNCLDCLDRTNMIQYLISCRALVVLLAEVGVVGLEPDRINDDDYHVGDIRRVLSSQGLALFRLMWAQNGDAIAMQYTGTGTLNSQFILTGHHHGEHNRETMGRKLADLVHAVGRYYLNNFVDSYRQDDYDMFLCNHRGIESGLSMDPSSYAKAQQRLQRRASISIGSAPQNQSSFLNYLLLVHRFLGPREMRTPLQFLAALVWMVFLGTWWLLFVQWKVQCWVVPWYHLLAHFPARQTAIEDESSVGEKDETRGREETAVVWRRPKSGIACWQGDDAPL